MKKSRHYLILIFFLLMIVSVFLSSCGIPTFCNLDGIKITRDDDSTNKKISFLVNGSSTDLQDVLTKGPGLLITYVFDDEGNTPDSNFISTYKSEFANKSNTKINIINSTISLSTKTLFVFKNYTNDGLEVHKPAQSWNYNLDLSEYKSTNISFNNIKFTLKFVTSDEDSVVIDLYKNDGTDDEDFIKGLSIEDPDSTKNYIHVFAAFSGEVGNFSNTYWSDLYYIGTLNIK